MAAVGATVGSEAVGNETVGRSVSVGGMGSVVIGGGYVLVDAEGISRPHPVVKLNASTRGRKMMRRFMSMFLVRRFLYFVSDAVVGLRVPEFSNDCNRFKRLYKRSPAPLDKILRE